MSYVRSYRNITTISKFSKFNIIYQYMNFINIIDPRSFSPTLTVQKRNMFILRNYVTVQLCSLKFFLETVYMYIII